MPSTTKSILNIGSMQHPYHHPDYTSYQDWRDARLSAALPMEPIGLQTPEKLDQEEKQQITMQLRHHNMALFHINDAQHFDTVTLRNLGWQFGLNRLDSNLYADENAISELRVIDQGRRGEYIPYTDRALGWHTDGYYNAPEKSINAFTLYCQQPAQNGGQNQLLNPEIAYIHLYEHDPRYCEALSKPDVLTIPATYENGELIRPEQQSPVFEIHPGDGTLNMRYTQRKTYIEWKDDSLTQDALSLLGDLLNMDTDPILNVRLGRGDGLICNNVLHNRSAFTDNPYSPRIMYRARYYDRIKVD